MPAHWQVTFALAALYLYGVTAVLIASALGITVAGNPVAIALILFGYWPAFIAFLVALYVDHRAVKR